MPPPTLSTFCVHLATLLSAPQFVGAQWNTGQDQMRVIKARMREMIPELQIFLDVDDLEDIAHLQDYIECTQVVLVFCSKGYFQSKNVARDFGFKLLWPSCHQCVSPLIRSLPQAAGNPTYRSA